MSSTRKVAVRIMLPAIGKVAPAILREMEEAIDKALQAERERAENIAAAHVQKNQDALDLAAGMPGTGMTQYALIERRDTAREIEAALREGKPQE